MAESKSTCAKPAGAVPLSKAAAPVVTNSAARSGAITPGKIPAVDERSPEIELTSPLVKALPAKSEYPLADPRERSSIGAALDRVLSPIREWNKTIATAPNRSRFRITLTGSSS